MKLLYPEFLFALGVLAIPVIIHLFNFRKFKQVYFPSLRFLQQIQQQTQKQSKLKHLLVLLARLLAFSFLVLAFARPYIPAESGLKKTGYTHVSIYLDNSFSMDNKGPQGYIFEEAKEKALELAGLFAPSDKFHLITNDLEGHHQRWVSRDEFIQLTEKVQLSGATRPFQEIYLRQKDIMTKAENDNRKAFAFSDFQKSRFDLSEFTPDSNLTYTLVPFENPNKVNVYIDSAWFNDPVRRTGTEEILHIRIKHNSETTIEAKCNLEINGKTVGFGNYRLEAGQTTLEAELPFTIYEKGMVFGKLYLNEYPDPDMLFDDTYYFAYTISEQISILSLYEPGPDSLQQYTRRIFGNKPRFNFISAAVDQLDYSLLPSQQCLILNDITKIPGGLAAELIRFVNEGGSLVLFPSSNAELNSWNNFLKEIEIDLLTPGDTGKMNITGLNETHLLYRDVFERIPENIDLPVMSCRFSIKSERFSRKEILLTLKDGTPYLTEYKAGKGKVYLFTSPLSPSCGNLVRHAIFVTTLYRIAETAGSTLSLAFETSKPNSVEIKDEFFVEGKTKVQAQNDEQSFIPSIKKEPGKVIINLTHEIKQAGHYSLNNEETVILPLAFNYNRLESETSTYSREELETYLSEKKWGEYFILADARKARASEGLAGIVLNRELWWHCIWLVILFLLVEIFLLRIK